jgi:hypothetical protein
MDQELFGTGKKQSREAYGHSMCIHQCVEGGCRDSSGSRFWTRYGNPLCKHAVSNGRHPNCNDTCQGFLSLGVRNGTYKFQIPVTKEEIEEEQSDGEMYGYDNDTMVVDERIDGDDTDIGDSKFLATEAASSMSY